MPRGGWGRGGKKKNRTSTASVAPSVTVTASITIKHIDMDSRRVKFSTVCLVRKKKVINGEAEVYIP